jgi:hypothetical protein
VRNIILLVLIASAGWYGYSQYQRRTLIPLEVATPATTQSAPESRFECDGRIHCSQMTSCAEATYFLQNCRGTKMDGDNDGIPCENQWCK